MAHDADVIQREKLKEKESVMMEQKIDKVIKQNEEILELLKRIEKKYQV